MARKLYAVLGLSALALANAQVDANPFDTGGLEGVENTVNTVMTLGAVVLVAVVGYGLVAFGMWALAEPDDGLDDYLESNVG